MQLSIYKYALNWAISLAFTMFSHDITKIILNPIIVVFKYITYMNDILIFIDTKSSILTASQQYTTTYTFRHKFNFVKFDGFKHLNE